MTNKEAIEYGKKLDKAIESRGDTPFSEARQFLSLAIKALEQSEEIPQKGKMGNTNIHSKNRVYDLLDEMRTSIISMDLSYSRTTELLNQILAIEKTVDSIE